MTMLGDYITINQQIAFVGFVTISAAVMWLAQCHQMVGLTYCIK
jgi:hypothetical protein